VPAPWEAAASLAAPMPIYEYKCPNGHLFEAIHGMTEPRPERCEICGEGPLQVVLHPVAVHYKGSGFYTTDYGRKSKKTAKEGSSGSDSGGSSADGGSSDSGESGSGTTEKTAAEA
jgi:putative FmdB family regulatory protein